MVGTTQQQIARYEKDENDLKSSMLIKLSKALNVSITYLLGLENAPWIVSPTRSASRLVPVVGRVAAGEAREAIEQNGRTHPLPEDLFAGKRDIVWVEVSGNSMNKLFPDGALVLIDQAADVRNGDVAAVFVNGEDVTIKRILFEGSAIVLHPESYDAEYRDRVIDKDDKDAPEVHIFGKAVSYTAPIGWRP